MTTPSNIKKIIDDVIEAEGGAKVTNHPNDPGGRTQYGISERANPEAWADGKVTNEEAREIYERKYLRGPGFDKITHARLQAQLTDMGVLSGPGVAIQKLQQILKVKVDGALGPKTLAAIEASDPVWLNNQLVASRITMIGRLVQQRPVQLMYLSGWLSRALSFMI